MLNCFSLRSLMFFALIISLLGSPSFADDEKNAGKKQEEQKLDLKLGGRVFGDWMWAKPDEKLENSLGPIISGNEWRAAWLELSGSYGKDISFMVMYDLAQGEAAAKDVWIGFNSLPMGQLRIGHMKEPFSLEMMVSGKNTVFMERSLANTLAPGRNTGIAVVGSSSEKNISWSAGIFTDADELGQAKAHDNNFGFSSRITFLPWKDTDSLLHLGAALHSREINRENRIRFSSRPEAHLVYKMLDSGQLDADSLMMAGVEFAAIRGRFLLQGEYIGAILDSPTPENLHFNGFYLFGSCFLTSDRHSYQGKSGTVGGVSPSRPFGAEDGTGAWEVALRFSQIEFDDALVTGGILKDVTLGLNWYMNNYARMMFNYIRADRDDIGTADIFQLRYQFSF